MNMDLALNTFFAESRELLTEMEAALLNVLDDVDPTDDINAIFRAAHTIKGSAGLFGIDAIVGFTHVVESVLDRVREGTIPISRDLVGLMLACRDHIGMLVERAAGETSDTADVDEPELLARLSAYLGDTPATPAAASAGPADAEPGLLGHWHISLRLDESVLRNGMDPLSFIRYLQRLGKVACVACCIESLPPLPELDPEACYLGFEIGLDSAADQATIANTFEFIADDCSIHILPPGTPPSAYLDLCRERGADPADFGERLARCGTLAPGELEALAANPSPHALQPCADEPRDAVRTDASCPPPAGKPRAAEETRTQEGHSIRIDADKLDHLINLVGELITASAGANLAARRLGNVELQECNSQVADLVESVRDSTLQLRMVKIGATFNRFRRVVHDVSRTLGKNIHLVVRGEDTELDKTVVERISDPLTHLVRNAMDHGIEPAETRIAHGKPGHGTITLDARHDSGHIVIEVSDDGGGLDRERILAKAVQRGLVEAGRELSDAEVFKLIFEPGFSTAAQVTDLSGRGVGMDVVKRNIEALRGSVEVSSRPALGTTVTVRLPLTLAIIDGFQVSVGTSLFVLPLDMVDECVAYSAHADHNYTDLRGRVLPFIRLRDMFSIPGPASARQNIVVVRHGDKRIGLVVDTLLGETQAVIKPLSRIFEQVRGISGSSILGSGEVALILDVPALMEQASHSPPAEHSRISA